MHTKGVIFDLDGTLIHAKIDFQGMRQALGMPEGDILHTIAGWSLERRQEAEAIIAAFEHTAAQQMTLMPGAHQVLDALWEGGIATGLVTRAL